MISPREIKRIARDSGVPISTIERDYVQNWLLRYLATIKMSLKGGTGIRKMYIRNYRFSDDLDFTLLNNLAENNMHKSIKDAVYKTREERGINFLDDIQTIRNDNGFEIHTYFRLLRTTGDPIRIKLDITKADQEILVLPTVKHPIFHSFSDACEMKVNAYPIMEIAAEKIRALFERTRPRDIYDVWYLHKYASITGIDEILTQKCNFKNIQVQSADIATKKEIYSRAWRGSLQHQLKNLPDFDAVFEETLRIIKKYETK